MKRLERDEFLGYIISWFVTAASAKADEYLGRDSKLSPLAGVRALQILWANRTLIPEREFDPTLEFCYVSGAKALWFKTPAFGRLCGSGGGDLSRQFSAGKSISLATLRFRKGVRSQVCERSPGSLDVKTLRDPRVTEWMAGFDGLAFSRTKSIGDVIIAYRRGSRSRWIGIRDEERIAAVAEFPAKDTPEWHERCLGLFPAIPATKARARRTADIVPFPRVRALPCLERVSDASNKLFRGFGRNPEGFEAFCQELLRNSLEIPHGEREQRSTASQAPQFIADLPEEDALFPTRSDGETYDQDYRLAAFGADAAWPPGRIVAVHLRFISEDDDPAGEVRAELDADDRLAARLGERPAYVVITTNLDEDFLLGVLTDGTSNPLREYEGRVVLFGRRGITDVVHSHYGMHRQAIGHPLDGRVLANPFMRLPAGTRLADNPGTLLQAKFGLVRFDRAISQEARIRLRAWLAEDVSMGVLLVTGPGGAGKTRLVSEFLRENAREWKTGVIHDHAAPNDMAALAQRREPVLCVLDYGETAPEKLALLVKEMLLAERRPGYPLKLLVAARSAGGWWRRLQDDAYAGSVVRSWEPVNLSSSWLDAEARHRLYVRAIADYARLLAVASPDPRQMPTFDSPDVARPLYVLMAALLTVYESRGDASGTGAFGHGGLLEAILTHEQRYWDQAIVRCAFEPSIADVLRGCIEPVVVALALLGGTHSEASTTALIDCVTPKCRRARDDLPRLLAGILWRLYPGHGTQDTDRAIAPLQPDLLADYLIDTRADKGLLDTLSASATFGDGDTLLRTLNRGAMDCPNTVVLLEHHIEHWIARDPATLLRIARETGRPITSLLATVLAKTGDVDLAAFVMDRCPSQELELLEVAAVATNMVLQRRKEQWPNPTEPQRDEIAGLANKLSIRLGRVGRGEEALSAAEGAVAIRRALASVSPDTYRPGLATALHTLGKRRADLGQDDDALAAAKEAVAIRRELAKIDPERCLPELATELGGLGAVLYKLQRHDESYLVVAEGLEVRRRLAERDGTTYRPKLASALSNTGALLTHLGRYKEALEKTEEARRIWEDLSAENPDPFERKVGIALNNLGRILAFLGRLDEARRRTHQALSVLQELAEEHPFAFTPDLGTARGTLGSILIQQERFAEAKDVLQQAIKTLLPFYRRHPSTFATRIESPLQDYSRTLEKLGLPHSAEDLASEFGLVVDEVKRLLSDGEAGVN